MRALFFWIVPVSMFFLLATMFNVTNYNKGRSEVGTILAKGIK